MIKSTTNATLTPGLTHQSHCLVAQANTAVAMGSGDMDVLATPAMIAMMENAAMLAVADALPTGDTTVGAEIHATHMLPTATQCEVTATATLTAIEGRRLTFDIEAHDDRNRVIGHASHVRYIVNRERFLSKL